MGRIVFIDSLKGLLMLCVIVGHLYTMCHYPHSMIYDIIVSFHMPAFIFVSGYVITLSDKSLFFNKLPKRISRLLIPFIVFGIIYTFYSGYNIYSFFIKPTKMGYWYFPVLAGCYLLLSLYASILQRNKKNVYFDLFFGVCITLVLLLVSRFVSPLFNNIFCLSLLWQFWPFFWVGHLLRKHEMFNNYLLENRICYTVAILLFVFSFWGYNIYRISYLHIVTALSAIVILFQLFKNNLNGEGRINSLLSIIGKKTLDIYVIHKFFLFAIDLNQLSQIQNGIKSYIFDIFILLIVSIIVAVFSICASKILRHSPLFEKYMFGTF